MDTTWFAVDRDGHVAVFDSGEAGAVPVDGYHEDWAPILDELVKAAGGKEHDPDDDDDRANRLAAMGLYYYAHEEWENALAGPYDRTGVPETPMPGPQVPRGLLKQMVSFDGRFAETAKLQPAEHWQSDAWSDGWVSADGTSVKCMPGHEAQYAEHFDELVESLDSTEGLTIEPPGAATSQRPPTASALPARRWWQFWKPRKP
jgi:hypothetical protein